MDTLNISGHIVDVLQRTIFPGTIVVVDGRIQTIQREAVPQDAGYILPGFVNAHVHIESSMLVPSECVRLATVHGTVAMVSDPHEIPTCWGCLAAVLCVPMRLRPPVPSPLAHPSCVPATTCETAGVTLSAANIGDLLAHEGLTYLSAMMNVPGVLASHAAPWRPAWRLIRITSWPFDTAELQEAQRLLEQLQP